MNLKKAYRSLRPQWLTPGRMLILSLLPVAGMGAIGDVFAVEQLEQLPTLLTQVLTQQVDTAAIFAQIQPSTVQITVPLNSDRPPVQGSGVIVGCSGTTYAVLTNWHVVNYPGRPVSITTVDGVTHPVSQIRPLDNIDAAVIYFSRQRSYTIAPLGDSQTLRIGEPLYAIGYPDEDFNLGSRDPTLQIFTFTSRLTGANVIDGYRLSYTANQEPKPGMSGSPLLNSKGQVVGLYGIAEGFNSYKYNGVPLDLILPAARQLGISFTACPLSPTPTPTVRPTPTPTVRPTPTPTVRPTPTPTVRPTPTPTQPGTFLGIPVEPFSYTTAEVSANGTVRTFTRQAEVGRYVEPRLNLPAGAVKLEMVAIEGGTFMMGQTETEKQQLIKDYGQETYDRFFNNEGPQHQVTVPDFFIGRYEVTQAQWFAVMGRYYNRRFGSGWQEDWASLDNRFKGDDLPMVQVSSDDAQEFILRLKQLAGKTYRFPTQAEWEYAARAGTTTPFSYGETITPDVVNYDGNDPYGNAPKGQYREVTIAVDELPANPWGLHHIHGNVSEWVERKWYNSINILPLIDRSRGLRGGSWYGDAASTRSANLGRSTPINRDSRDGFRVVLVP